MYGIISIVKGNINVLTHDPIHTHPSHPPIKTPLKAPQQGVPNNNTAAK